MILTIHNVDCRCGTTRIGEEVRDEPICISENELYGFFSTVMFGSRWKFRLGRGDSCEIDLSSLIGNFSMS